MRHAHAGDKQLWEGSDAERPLSKRGRQEAHGVAEILRSMPAARLLSSPYLRCHQTLVPLSARMGLPITTNELLSPGSDPEPLDALVTDPAMDGTVLCTHGETVNELMTYWRRRKLLDVPFDDPQSRRQATQKGAVWIIETSTGYRTVHYLQPVLVGPTLAADAELWN